MLRIVTLAVVLVFGASLAARGWSASSPSFPKAAAPVAAAALAQESVHWTRTVVPQTGVAYTWTADVNADSGRAWLTLPSGAVLQIRLVDDTLYVRGDYSGLLGAFSGSPYRPGLSPARAQKYARRWISISKGGLNYGFLADGLTLGSIVHDAIPRGRLESSMRKTRGTRLLVLRGSGEAHSPLVASDLTAHASGTPLPIAFSRGSPRARWGYHVYWLTGHFSKWNEPVHVEAPARSTPIATVRGLRVADE